MYVLHLSRTALAGAPIRLSQLLNKYSDVKSRCATAVTTGIVFPEDIKVPFHRVGRNAVIHDSEELNEETKKADIIHIHNYPPCRPDSAIWELFKHKPVILQLHSPPDKSEMFFHGVSSRTNLAKLLVIAQYQAIYIKLDGLHIVRNAIDINDPLLKPIVKSYNPPTLSYAPSVAAPQCQCAHWVYKSYDEVVPLFRKLRSAGLCNYVITQHMEYKRSLKARQPANIHVDEVHTGSYHLSSLEGLSQGSVVIAKIAGWMFDLLKQVTGCTTIPWAVANKDNIESVIRGLLSDKNNLLKKQQESRNWMEKYWNPELILNDYLSVYKETT